MRIIVVLKRGRTRLTSDSEMHDLHPADPFPRWYKIHFFKKESKQCWGWSAGNQGKHKLVKEGWGKGKPTLRDEVEPLISRSK